MDISSQHMDELFRIERQQSPQQAQKKVTGSAENFGDILNNALVAQEPSDTSPMYTSLLPRSEQADMISKMLLQPLNQDSGEALTPHFLQDTLANASGTLDLWDSYAKTLESASGNNGLRDAYSILENIGVQISQLKNRAASLKSNDFGLNSLINELDIMATTERIKFNRGDYA
ncbi:MAG: hypothetical protein IJU76_10070 [Desulfovibrionaceae bacterium]|nr:hypothetical protein [Desulfovibrionaceae bacterium]